MLESAPTTVRGSCGESPLLRALRLRWIRAACGAIGGGAALVFVTAVVVLAGQPWLWDLGAGDALAHAAARTGTTLGPLAGPLLIFAAAFSARAVCEEGWIAAVQREGRGRGELAASGLGAAVILAAAVLIGVVVVEPAAWSGLGGGGEPWVRRVGMAALAAGRAVVGPDGSVAVARGPRIEVRSPTGHQVSAERGPEGVLTGAVVTGFGTGTWTAERVRWANNPTPRPPASMRALSMTELRAKAAAGSPRAALILGRRRARLLCLPLLAPLAAWWTLRRHEVGRVGLAPLLLLGGAAVVVERLADRAAPALPVAASLLGAAPPLLVLAVLVAGLLTVAR